MLLGLLVQQGCEVQRGHPARLAPLVLQDRAARQGRLVLPALLARLDLLAKTAALV